MVVLGAALALVSAAMPTLQPVTYGIDHVTD
jgi:hypothetical protein